MNHGEKKQSSLVHVCKMLASFFEQYIGLSKQSLDNPPIELTN